MKKVMWLLIASMVFSAAIFSGPVKAAFPADDLQVLEQKDITALADDKLIENYVDVLVEMEAVKAFHLTSGFTPKEYKKYKELLKYRLLLNFEINRRKLELPPSFN